MTKKYRLYAAFSVFLLLQLSNFRVAAEKVLVDADLRRKKRKKVIDMMAAVVILQNYLDSKSFKI